MTRTDVPTAKKRKPSRQLPAFRFRKAERVTHRQTGVAGTVYGHGARASIDGRVARCYVLWDSGAGATWADESNLEPAPDREAAP